MSQFANTVSVVVDAEWTNKTSTPQDGCHNNHSDIQQSAYIYVLYSISFDLYGSCTIRALQKKARSHCVMLVLGGHVIRSIRHELGCTGRCIMGL